MEDSDKQCVSLIEYKLVTISSVDNPNLYIGSLCFLYVTKIEVDGDHSIGHYRGTIDIKPISNLNTFILLNIKCMFISLRINVEWKHNIYQEALVCVLICNRSMFL